jgi:DNA topoisomerase-1
MTAQTSPPPTSPPAEYVATAKQARLRYWTDDEPAIRRVRSGTGFHYLSPRGQTITDEKTLARIRQLAIPPAWTEVRICPSPVGHLQATGRDVKGRKQYHYHDRWREVRDETKFDRLIAFAAALPRIRRRVQQDLKLPGLPRDKILATVVRLLETTLIRVGNDEYVRENRSFGLTTLRNPHARVRKDDIHFEFRGKSGVQHCVTIRDRRLAQIVKRCQEIPGQELFQYLDEEGKRHPIDSAAVNEYLQAASDGPFTAKDFRTWGATVLAARAFHELPAGKSQAETKRHLTQAVEAVACQLGNTATVCRKCYIHSAILETYLNGTLAQTLTLPPRTGNRPSNSRLTPEEHAVLRWLQKGQKT